MSDYQYAFKRLDKLRKTIEQLVVQNQELNKANAKLRAEHGTWEAREHARERVLKLLSEEKLPKLLP